MTARVPLTRSLTAFLLLLFAFPFTSANLKAQQSSPSLLTYNELVQLYENAEPSAPLANKLTRLLSTPFVNNSFGVRPATRSAGNNAFVRVATWNIERGLEFDAVKAALTNDHRFFRQLPPAERSSKFNLAQINEQARALSRADVIVLNEAD